MARTFCADAQRATIAIAALALVLIRSRLARPARGDRRRRSRRIGGGSQRRKGGGRRFRAASVAPCGASSRWRSFSRCWPCRLRPPARGWRRSPPLSIAQARWCSAAAMSCCRCCATRWFAPGFLSQGAFLAGYGAAQALPGPLFAVSPDSARSPVRRRPAVAGGLVALIAIFLPGLLALVAALPFWGALRGEPRAQAAMAASMRRWSDCSPRRSMIRRSSARLRAPAISPSRRRPFVLLVAWRAPPLFVCGGSLRRRASRFQL